VQKVQKSESIIYIKADLNKSAQYFSGINVKTSLDQNKNYTKFSRKDIFLHALSCRYCFAKNSIFLNRFLFLA